MINTIIFDLGGVLIDWSPLYVYQTLIPDEERRNFFFENICTSHWNEQQDGGRTWAEATALLIAAYPEWESEIRAFYDQWEGMLKGEIDGTVEIFRELRQREDLKIYALTNWSAETWPVALRRFEFLAWFDGILVSGIEHTRKPFPEIYQLLLNRYQIQAENAVFIDDVSKNIEAAQTQKINGIQFLSPAQLREDLVNMGIL